VILQFWEAMLSHESEHTDPLLERRQDTRFFSHKRGKTFVFFACTFFALALVRLNSNSTEEKLGVGQALPAPRLSIPVREPSEGYPEESPPSYASEQAKAKKWEEAWRFEQQQQAIADKRREAFLQKQREALKEYETLKAAQTPKLSATASRAKLPQGMPPSTNVVQPNPSSKTGGTRLYPPDLIVPGSRPRTESQTIPSSGTAQGGVPGSIFPPPF